MFSVFPRDHHSRIFLTQFNNTTNHPLTHMIPKNEKNLSSSATRITFLFFFSIHPFMSHTLHIPFSLYNLQRVSHHLHSLTLFTSITSLVIVSLYHHFYTIESLYPQLSTLLTVAFLPSVLFTSANRFFLHSTRNYDNTGKPSPTLTPTSTQTPTLDYSDHQHHGYRSMKILNS